MLSEIYGRFTEGFDTLQYVELAFKSHNLLSSSHLDDNFPQKSVKIFHLVAIDYTNEVAYFFTLSIRSS